MLPFLNAEWQRDLAVSYWRMADLSEKLSRDDEAQGWWQRALDTMAGMKQRGQHLSPQDEQVLEWLRGKV